MNRVRDDDSWRVVFDGEANSAQDAGLKLLNRWRELDAPQVVSFLMAVRSREQAEAYTGSPAAAAVGERAGVLDGWCAFVESP